MTCRFHYLYEKINSENGRQGSGGILVFQGYLLIGNSEAVISQSIWHKGEMCRMRGFGRCLRILFLQTICSRAPSWLASIRIYWDALFSFYESVDNICMSFFTVHMQPVQNSRTDRDGSVPAIQKFGCNGGAVVEARNLLEQGAADGTSGI